MGQCVGWLSRPSSLGLRVAKVPLGQVKKKHLCSAERGCQLVRPSHATKTKVVSAGLRCCDPQVLPPRQPKSAWQGSARHAAAHLHRHDLHAGHAGPPKLALCALVVCHALRQQPVVFLLPWSLQRPAALAAHEQMSEEAVDEAAVATEAPVETESACYCSPTWASCPAGGSTQVLAWLSFSLRKMRDSHLTWRAPTWPGIITRSCRAGRGRMRGCVGRRGT